ncbi:hypothetical protein ES703_69196 [subsurface metagenome]
MKCSGDNASKKEGIAQEKNGQSRDKPANCPVCSIKEQCQCQNCKYVVPHDRNRGPFKMKLLLKEKDIDSYDCGEYGKDNIK